MDFARNLLLKYGWKEGRGLGKQESGISAALKPKLKFNTEGFGFNSSEQFTHHWWEQAYNNAANNIGVRNTEDGDVAIKSLNKNPSKVITRRIFISDSEKEKLEYGSFKKVAVLKDRVLIGTSVSSSEDSEQDESTGFRNLTDEELFLACRGRTGHKAARHGHKLNGKLARISNQDQMYSLSNGEIGDSKVEKIQDTKKFKTCKKSKKDKEKVECLRFIENDLSCEKLEDGLEHNFDKLKKKSRRKKLNKREEIVEELNCNVSVDKNVVGLISNCFIQGSEARGMDSEEINGCKKKKKRKSHVLEQEAVFSDNLNGSEEGHHQKVALERIKVKKKKQKIIC